jgi:glycosyltransferase involved in cell wall biosynthesis
MVHDYPPFTGGGLATAVNELVCLLGDDFEFTVLSSRLVDHFADDRARANGARSVGVRVGGLATCLTLARRVDLIVAHWTFSCRRLSTFALAVGPQLGKPTLCVIHTGPLHLDHNRFRHVPARGRGALFAMLDRLTSRAVAVVALSPSHAASLRGVGLQPSHVLAIPVLPRDYSTAASRQRSGTALTVGVAGELSTLKGANYLPALIRDLTPATRFRVVGRGPLRGSLDDFVRSLKPRQRACVDVGDRVPPWEMAEFYRSIDCVLVLSDAESQCRVALEAMAAGVIVLARPVDGLKDLLEEGHSGLFVEPTPASVGQALASIAAGGPAVDALRSAARERASAHFTESTRGWRSLLHASSAQRSRCRASDTETGSIST